MLGGGYLREIGFVGRRSFSSRSELSLFRATDLVVYEHELTGPKTWDGIKEKEDRHALSTKRLKI